MISETANFPTHWGTSNCLRGFIIRRAAAGPPDYGSFGLCKPNLGTITFVSLDKQSNDFDYHPQAFPRTLSFQESRINSQSCKPGLRTLSFSFSP